MRHRITVLNDVNISLISRKIKHIDDWGDNLTIGLQLKKYGANIFSSSYDFGVYLGCINEKYLVGRYNEKTVIDRIDAFDTKSEMKHNWRPD